MDWTTILKAQQTDFIERLKSGDLFHCEKEGRHSELTVISEERLKQLRDFCWEMANKFKQQNDVKNIFFNNMKGKLGEEVFKSRLGDLVTEVDYEKRIGGDGKVDFTLTSDSSIGIQVKTRYGNCDQVQWTIYREEIEKNSVLVCILCQEEFSENEKEYRLIIAGFLPTNIIKSSGDKTLVRIDELLYPGSLRGYLESLTSYDADKYISLGDECLDKKDYEGAAFHYNQALQLRPNDSLIYKKRGLARYFLGDKQSAIDDYTKAIKINPNLAIAYYRRGIFHCVLGDNQSANADFKQAADLFYKQGDQEFYQEALDRIRELELQEDNKSQKQLQQLWNVGDHVIHKRFGTGEITHVFGSQNKVSLAIKFNKACQKIIDPTIAQLVKID
ncbi:tetratricopeptide repeat protein [Anabaena catenula]|uniref:Tetratricopeptide repeat protein n=1 Tax=Anabaena catenula FACHB-362 TaxID=2692877 RepID=A0ABR8J2X8_9NOST|nr:tetratricopeptide repeat protein [Anabaena catenula]MBD2692500.1 tetratricopeptide repeat protein [Anabaena catenula FACHB-362]